MIDNVRGGVSNTPLTVTKSKNNEFQIISEIKLEKRILFDWVSYTFDTLDYNEVFIPGMHKTFIDLMYTENNDFILGTLFSILGVRDQVTNRLRDWKKYEQSEFAVNGFRFSFKIGEHIQINFAGPKSANNRITTQILLPGQACRELIEYNRSDTKFFWVELFSYLVTLGGHFKRVDLAIDDFTGKEQNIYNLLSYAKNRHFKGSYRSCTIFEQLGYINNQPISKGFSMTFGSSGSNQCQIYDKNLERKSQNYETFGTDVWYRYEMRLVDDKADELVKSYLAVMSDITDESTKLSNWAMSVLNGQIEFLEPPTSKDNQRWRWETLESWKNFTEAVGKITLHSHSKVEKTIDRKMKWYDRSIVSSNSQFFLVDPDNYVEQHLIQTIKGLEDITEDHLVPVNKKRIELGKKPYSLSEVQSMGSNLEQDIYDLIATRSNKKG